MVSSIEQYLATKQLSWAPSTIRSTRFRLRSVVQSLTGTPIDLWNSIKDTQAPYSRVSTWNVVVSYWEWLHPGVNPYETFRKENQRLFKNAYVRKPAKYSFDEAMQRIKRHPRLDIRNKAEQLLRSGMRYTESLSLKDGFVVGKGGKSRQVFVPELNGPVFNGSYFVFYHELGRVGLKPHDLRKIGLSRLVELGANEFDLTHVAGWSSISTASSYIRMNHSRIESLLKKL